MSLEEARFLGSCWYDPVSKKIYAGRAGETYAGQLTFDVSTIEAKVVLDEVLGLARPLYKLDRCVRVISTPELVLSVDVATALTGQEKVKPLVEAEISAEAWTRAEFSLWKNVVHVVVEDEARKRAAHDILRVKVEDAAKELARMRNAQIKTELETATAVAGSGDWGAMTTPPNSDHNPFTDIASVLETIEGNGFTPSFMAVHPRVYNDFITNSYVRDLVQAGIVKVGDQPTVTLPGWPNVEIVVDSAMTNTLAVIGAKEATILAEGPTESARYRHEPKGYDAFIIRQWLQPKIVQSGAIRKLTGVSA